MKEKIDNNGGTLLTIEKYFRDGKVNRVVIRTNHNNYLLDLPVDSFTARSFLIAAITVIRAFSFIINNFTVAVEKFTTSSLV